MEIYGAQELHQKDEEPIQVFSVLNATPDADEFSRDTMTTVIKLSCKTSTTREVEFNEEPMLNHDEINLLTPNEFPGLQRIKEKVKDSPHDFVTFENFAMLLNLINNVYIKSNT